MSVIGVLGLIAGFTGSKIVNKTGEGFYLDIVLGIVGAIVGGVIFTAVGYWRHWLATVLPQGRHLWAMICRDEA